MYVRAAIGGLIAIGLLVCLHIALFHYNSYRTSVATINAWRDVLKYEEETWSFYRERKRCAKDTDELSSWLSKKGLKTPESLSHAISYVAINDHTAALAYLDPKAHPFTDIIDYEKHSYQCMYYSQKKGAVVSPSRRWNWNYPGT